jgi:thiol-disulfide isomerase/thioredoxin
MDARNLVHGGSGCRPVPVGRRCPSPKPFPELQFDDDGGRSHSLKELQGKIVLLNLWATWCAPCRKEMPTLDRLEASLGGPEFEVAVLSLDRRGIEAVSQFYTELGITHLAKYVDTSSQVLGDLNAIGLPTTILIDREGREIGRLVGPAEWDSREIAAFIRGWFAKQTGSFMPNNLPAFRSPALDHYSQQRKEVANEHPGSIKERR